MVLFKIIVICVLMALATSRDLFGSQGCEQGIEAVGMQCALKHPELLVLAETNMQKDDQMRVVFDKICSNKETLENIVDVAMCVAGKMMNCYPMFKPITKLLLSRKHMLNAMGVVCKNKYVLQDNCMEANMQPFMTCYMGKVATLQMTMKYREPKDVVCSVVHSEENCLEENKGTCSTNYINVLKQLLESLFPMENCGDPKVVDNDKPTKKSDLANSILQSILVHGQPQGLKFSPYGKFINRPYVIKN